MRLKRTQDTRQTQHKLSPILRLRLMKSVGLHDCTLVHLVTPEYQQVMTYTHMHTHAHTCTHMHMHTCTHAHTHAHMHIRTHAHMLAHTCTHICSTFQTRRIMSALINFAKFREERLMSYQSFTSQTVCVLVFAHVFFYLLL